MDPIQPSEENAEPTPGSPRALNAKKTDHELNTNIKGLKVSPRG
jgi:hypothetical protein